MDKRKKNTIQALREKEHMNRRLLTFKYRREQGKPILGQMYIRIQDLGLNVGYWRVGTL
jgi:hypothetical protein